MLTCRLFVAIDVTLGAIEGWKDATKEMLGDAKLDSLQFRAMVVSFTGGHARKATRSEVKPFQNATPHQ